MWVINTDTRKKNVFQEESTVRHYAVDRRAHDRYLRRKLLQTKDEQTTNDVELLGP